MWKRQDGRITTPQYTMGSNWISVVCVSWKFNFYPVASTCSTVPQSQFTVNFVLRGTYFGDTSLIHLEEVQLTFGKHSNICFTCIYWYTSKRMYYLICLWLFLHISLYDSTSLSIRQGAVVISSLLVSHGEAQQFSDGRGARNQAGAGNLIPKMASDQLWRHHLDPTNGTQHTAAWFIGFFLKHQTPWLKAASEFFLFALVFFFGTSQQIYKNSMRRKTLLYNYTHVYVTIFLFHFRWLSRLAFNKRSQKDSCTLRLLYSTVVAGRLIFLSHPAHPAILAPGPSKPQESLREGFKSTFPGLPDHGLL